jgi:hypothetical protein
MSITVELTNGQRINVQHDAATIGQDPASDICMPNSPQVQPTHARIVKVAHKWMIQAAGDWLLQVGNGVPGRKLWLNPGDVISLSESGPRIIFEPKPAVPKTAVTPAEPASAPIPAQMPPAQPASVPLAQPVSVPLAQPVPPTAQMPVTQPVPPTTAGVPRAEPVPRGAPAQEAAADSSEHPLPPFLQPLQRTPPEKPNKPQPAKKPDEEDEVWEEVFGYWMDDKQK